MKDLQRLRRDVNLRIAPQVPTTAWESTVAIVVANPPTVHLFATGILFQIADCHFVVTAGHAIRAAHEHRKTIGLGDTGTDNLIALSGDFMSSVPGEGEGDPYDVAVRLLPAETVAKLAAKRFLRITDVSFSDPGPKAVFSLFGYPGVWSEPSRSDSDRIRSKALEFTTYAFDGDSTALIGYQPHLHLLLSAGIEDTTWTDGSSIDFRDRAGQSARFPIGLQGISGCSVWHIGDLSVAIEKWRERPPALVGIETGVYQASGVITASRWAVVTTLIHKAFPDLRRSIELHQP
jgi:hypothetical protein